MDGTQAPLEVTPEPGIGLHVTAEVNLDGLRDMVVSREEVRKAAAMAEQSAGIEVVDTISNDSATGALVVIRTGRRVIEDARKAVSRLFTDASKSAAGMLKELDAPLEETDTAICKNIASWRESERVMQANTKKIAEDAIAKAQAEIQAAMPPGAAAPAIEVYVAPPPNTTRTAHGSVTGRQSWTFKVVDLTKLPREWMVPDETKIRKAVAAGIRVIPGVDIFVEEGLSVKLPPRADA